MKIHYISDEYQSHLRVATAYRSLIKQPHQLVDDFHDAEVIIIHTEPYRINELFRSTPALQDKYKIGYWVWEADELPDMHKRLTSKVQEIWTPSKFCCEVFGKYHSNITLIPHVIERCRNTSEEDIAFIRQITDYDERLFYYLIITRVRDLRKNIRQLIKAFRNVSSKMPNARLIIKAAEGDSAEHINEPGVIFLPVNLTEGQINALYTLSQVYVSPHHAEGWGLTISDAMIFDKPVIATGYSGNLEFMNSENSFLLDFTLEHIRPRDWFYEFGKTMRWAYPNQENLESTLLELYEGYTDVVVQQKVERASMDIKQFQSDRVGALITSRLDEISRLI